MVGRAGFATHRNQSCIEREEESEYENDDEKLLRRKDSSDSRLSMRTKRQVLA